MDQNKGDIMVKTESTNWDLYYSRPNKFSRITRNFTINNILKIFISYTPSVKNIIELGGANSCIYETVRNEFPEVEYCIIDNNEIGLNLFRTKYGSKRAVKLINADLTKDLNSLELADIVFSLGLIEHFSPINTAYIIKQHFKLVKNNGLVVITFPTPTWLYRVSRAVAEYLGLWIFHDERPLRMEEVIDEMKKHGEIQQSYVNWKIIFTQGVVVAKSNPRVF